MITPGQAIRTIRAKKISSSYFLLGGEPFLEDCLIDELFNFFIGQHISKIHFSMDQDSFEDLLKELSSISLFQDKRIVVVRELKKIRSEKNRKEIIKYLDSPNLNIILILISDEYDIKNTFLNKISKFSKTVDVRTPFEREMKKWILFYLKKKKIKISNDVLDKYIEIYGDYISHVINEIRNTSIILGADKEINEDSIHQLEVYDRIFPLWSIQDSLGSKNLSLSLEILNSFLINGTKITVITINLVNLFKQILLCKMGKVELIGYTGINKIIAKKLKIYEKRFSFNELAQILQELKTIDLLSKTVSINHQLLLEKFFVKICKGLYV